MEVEDVLKLSKFRGQPNHFRDEQLPGMQMNNRVSFNVLYKPEEKAPNDRRVSKLKALKASYLNSSSTVTPFVDPRSEVTTPTETFEARRRLARSWTTISWPPRWGG